MRKPVEFAGPTAESSLSGQADFAEVYSAHAQPIFYLCLRMLGDQQKAEDAAHDVFLRAFQHLESFRGESSWRTWLYRIAINHCKNVQQTWHARHMVPPPDDAFMGNVPSQAESPLRVLEARELGERIQATLDRLSPEYSLILLLVADQELSYEQVGKLTNQSADAVRGKLHRARKAFSVEFAKTA